MNSSSSKPQEPRLFFGNPVTRTQRVPDCYWLKIDMQGGRSVASSGPKKIRVGIEFGVEGERQEEGCLQGHLCHIFKYEVPLVIDLRNH